MSEKIFRPDQPSPENQPHEFKGWGAPLNSIEEKLKEYPTLWESSEQIAEEILKLLREAGEEGLSFKDLSHSSLVRWSDPDPGAVRDYVDLDGEIRETPVNDYKPDDEDLQELGEAAGMLETRKLIVVKDKRLYLPK